MTEQGSTERPDGTIWVGFDGSDAARHAMDWAARFGTARDRAVQPVSAWQHLFLPFPLTEAPVTEADAEKEADDRIQSWFEQWRAATEAPATSVQPPLVVHAQPAQILCELPGESDLVVVGSRGHGLLKRVALGSVSSRCAAESACPVAVIPSAVGDTDVARVLVGYDGSDHAESALRWAIANNPGSAIEVVSIWATPTSATPISEFLGHEQHNAWVKHLLDQAVSSATDLAAEHECTLYGFDSRGDARTMLADLAADYDLLVVGAHAESGVRRIALGSVAQATVHRTQVPTVVVPTS